ncbi:uncharacterized protein J3D65DRAFT_101971 [Phyllosticta citribraziliensis]|uniref:BZIP domain-containing protein n=1 Tax=Phyllosticta citribraziliensis TaxID=989973 RepID=A0ABR1LCY1_9PEZI
MSGYGDRKTPGASVLQGLNTFPSPKDMAAENNNLNFDEDLSLFTNTEFFDFDLGTEITSVAQQPQPPVDAVPDNRGARRQSTMSFQPPAVQPKPVDFNFNGDFQSLDFSSFPVGGLPDPNFAHQPNPYPIQQHNGTASSSPLSAPSPVNAKVGDKRKIDSIHTPTAGHNSNSIEELSRMAAEEDKRRRNTAASARFRIKKKQREQQLEKTAKEMTDKVSSLESRIAQLEMENKWLKGLITEKNDGKNASDLTELYRKVFVNKDNKDDRSKGDNKDGVGTTAGKD